MTAQRALHSGRRPFLASLGAVLLPVPIGTLAQDKTRRVGYLAPGLAPVFAFVIEALQRGLRDHGWVDGQNVKLEMVSSNGRDDLFPRLAADMAAQRPDAIVAVTVPAIRAVQQATKTIPIVMVLSSDPVQMGLITSLGHPGGNTTGLASAIPNLAPKRLEMLKDLIPTLSRAAVLWNPSNLAMLSEWNFLSAAAESLRIKLLSVEVRSPEELGAAFTAILQDRHDALVVVGDPLTFLLRRQIADFASQNRLPAVFAAKEFVEAGGLMSYGSNIADMFYRAAGYVDKILKGANPADLPVEQPVKMDAALNLKTARALGLTFPQKLLVRADVVVE